MKLHKYRIVRHSNNGTIWYTVEKRFLFFFWKKLSRNAEEWCGLDSLTYGDWPTQDKARSALDYRLNFKPTRIISLVVETL
jgi:hypothetical protein